MFTLFEFDHKKNTRKVNNVTN